LESRAAKGPRAEAKNNRESNVPRKPSFCQSSNSAAHLRLMSGDNSCNGISPIAFHVRKEYTPDQNPLGHRLDDTAQQELQKESVHIYEPLQTSYSFSRLQEDAI
jgi:hypothetical protein